MIQDLFIALLIAGLVGIIIKNRVDCTAAEAKYDQLKRDVETTYKDPEAVYLTAQLHRVDAGVFNLALNAHGLDLYHSNNLLIDADTNEGEFIAPSHGLANAIWKWIDAKAKRALEEGR